MHRAARLAVVAFAGLLAACAQTTPPTASSVPRPTMPPLDVSRYQTMVVDARTLIDQKRQTEAIAKDLDPVIAAYEQAYGHSGVAYFSIRTLPETMLYLTMGVGQADQPGGVSAVALDLTWSVALYLKGYALVDLHRYAEAHDPLEHAVRLAPSNAQYLAELGQLYAYEHRWPQALDLYARAERGAALSPPELKTQELTRALRGTAFVDVELGRLDEAAALYERCLALDPADKKAAGELGYVHARQSRQVSRPSTSR